jgi:hypothetical protein
VPALDAIRPDETGSRAWYPDLALQPDLACRCASPFSEGTPCVSVATAEDMRCDVCRAGCTRITLTNTANGAVVHHSHVKLPVWSV